MLFICNIFLMQFLALKLPHDFLLNLVLVKMKCLSVFSELRRF
jgi:hypothetical protein